LEHPNGHKSHELLHTHYVRRGKFNEFTGERFDLGTRPTQKKRDVAAQEIRAAQAAAQESKHAREDLESVRVLALEAENSRLKAELADVTETVGFFKNVIADYASREK
ncbi:MAG: iron hydrogenase small subunit, partial [Clostridiaceae bacterium]